MILAWALVIISGCQSAPELQASLGVQNAENRSASEESPHQSSLLELVNIVSTDEWTITESNLGSGPGFNQGEVSVAINRYNTDQAVAAVMSVEREPNDGPILLVNTQDGGKTWHQQSIRSSPSTLIADPMLAWDAEGRVFLAQIPVIGGTSPIGIDVIRSLDGGFTWESTVRLSSAQNMDDKVALTVDDQLDSPWSGNVYVAWKWPGGPIWFSRSTDHGVSFSTPQDIDNKATSGLDLTVAKDGTIILAHSFGSEGIYVQRSIDGGQLFQPAVKASDKNAGFEVFPSAHCSDPGAFINASIDAYRPGDEESQTVLLTWVDYPDSSPSCSTPCGDDCPTQVRYSVSRDNGQSWAIPQSINSGGGSQFFQWSDIDQENGDWYIIFKDTSADPVHRKTHTLMVRSTDEGQSWSDPVQLSSASGATFRWPGHYQGMAAHDGKIYAGWADYRSHVWGDFYMASVEMNTGDGFIMNAGLNDAWVNTEAPFQGMFITVFPVLKLVFVAWFTFESESADDTLMAGFGASDQRWVTGIGSIDGNRAELNMELTFGGVFNQSDPMPLQDTDYGSMILEFTDCAQGFVSYDFPSVDLSGEFAINRVLESNIALCEALNQQSSE